MWNGQDTLYGNEWIDYDRYYFKIMLAEDGIYRVSYQTLQEKIPANIEGKQLQLFHMGEEIPMYVTNENTLGANDYLEFYGQKNSASLDTLFFQNGASDMLNPYYSMFTDTSAYYITWTDTGEPANRYLEIPNNISGSDVPEPYFIHRSQKYGQSSFIKKSENFSGSSVSTSSFDIGRGYAMVYPATGDQYNEQTKITLETPYVYDQGPDAKVVTRFVGRRGGSHSHALMLGDTELITASMYDYTYTRRARNLSLDLLNDETEFTFLAIADSSGNKGKHAIGSIYVEYPRLFNFDNQSYFQFNIQASSQVTYLEIENFDGGSSPVLYDITNKLRLAPVIDAGLLKIALPPSTKVRELVLVNASIATREVTELQDTDFINYFEEEGNFVLLTHPALFDDGNGNNWVQTYADHRRSFTGGGYDPIIIDVQQLYDQFAYGIHRHSAAITNFAHFMVKNWSDPQYVFIIGKARELHQIRTEGQLTAHNQKTFFVPTYGSPGADVLMFATPNTRPPIVSIGRLPVTSGADLKTYYDKVLEFEASLNLPQTLTDKGWMKRVIHLGGGGQDDHQIIRNHLTGFKNIIESNDFGADVFSFFKTSSDPIQSSQSEALFNAINGGASIVTFFGHSSASGFDFSTDSPENYGNQGKYPLMFSFGCHSGQCHEGFESIGEQFILAEQSGAIAYIASTGFGFIHSLRSFGNEYYSLLGGDLYGKGVGDILKESISIFKNSGSRGDQVLAEQTTLQGDPAIRLNAHPGPDFLVDISSVSNDPPLVNTQLDFFDLNFDIHNIGINNRDSFFIHIDQQYPTGEIVNLVREEVKSEGFKNNFTFQVPMLKRGNEVGQNYFHIRVDQDKEIEELPAPEAELNNNVLNQNGTQGFPVLITSNDLVPMYPRPFAIVNDPELTLKAVTADVFAKEQVFVLQLDTTENFNSAAFQEKIMQGVGGVMKWKPSIDWQNEQVYYWRVSPDSTDAEVGYRWFNSSFVFLEDHDDGWNQSHYFQYKKDRLNNKTLPETTQKLRYIEDFKDLKLSNNMRRDNWGDRPYITLNQENINWWQPPIENGVLIAVLDSLSVDPWKDQGNQYGDDGGFGDRAFPFLTSNVTHREELINFLQDSIPIGNYVVFFTYQNFKTQDSLIGSYFPEQWAMDSVNNNLGVNLFQVLENQGAQLVRKLENGSVPYTFVFKKDDPSFEPKEALASDPFEYLVVEYGIAGVWDSGMVTSTEIGPVKEWNKFQWSLDDFDDSTEDVYFNVKGFNPATETEEILYEGITEPELDLSDIDPLQYPFLRLEYFSSDTLNRTPPQIGYWRVLYEGLPEAALNPAAHFSFSKDTLEQGENLELEIAVENIGQYDMDSMLVAIKIVDVNNQQVRFDKLYRPLLVEDTIIATLNFDTRTISGPQTIIIEANPDDHQPELTHQNNIGVINFHIREDVRNPLLDVTFDGIHIMDGDIVSPKTNILITLQDENKYLALADTSLFKVLLTYPDEPEPIVLPFDGTIMQFFPADESNLGKENKASIELSPDLYKDGTYKLMIQAQDVSGNVSGLIDYNISFEVISKAMISNVLNYPNPFTTSTQFVYTLTGIETPAYYKIQIMTVSGRIVREITQDELGELRIGTHRTDYAWDGTDQFGDRLANGVYLYRFVAKNADGSDYENYQRDSVDKFFQKGFGKMVLLK